MSKNKNNFDYDFSRLRYITGGLAGFTYEYVGSPVHSHVDFYELIIVTSGEWQNHIGDTTSSLSQGTLTLFKPGVTHQLFTEPSKSSHFVFCVKQSFFESFAKRNFPHFDIDSLTSVTTKTLHNEKFKYLKHLANTVALNIRTYPFIGEEMLYLCLSDFANQNDALDCDAYISEIIQKLNDRSYMYSSVAEICSHYPFSQTLLTKRFKTFTGCTIVEYKAEQKLKHACQLLCESNTRVTEIVMHLEYNSLSYFLQLFKKRFGMTPTEYRKRYRKAHNKEN